MSFLILSKNNFSIPLFPPSLLLLHYADQSSVENMTGKIVWQMRKIEEAICHVNLNQAEEKS